MIRLLACIAVMLCLATPVVAQPSSAASPARTPVSREPYRFPFATRDAWLAFVAGTPGGTGAATAYRGVYSDSDYARWTSGGVTTTERITYRSGGLSIRACWSVRVRRGRIRC